MDSLTSNLDEQYGKKQDVLVEGFLPILQTILMEKRDQWEQDNRHKKDFYESHPCKKWNKDEAPKIQSRDITKWDTSLCSKWLREFKWTSAQKLSLEEMSAIANLVSIRNGTKHTATSGDVTQQQFEENCELCENSLQALNTDPVVIQQILTNARNACVVDQSKLIQRIQETHWQYETKDVLGTGAFGVVISVRDEIDHSISAIKLIVIKDWNDKFDHKAFREARNLQKLNDFQHQNVVKYKMSALFKFTHKKLSSILKWDDSVYKDKQLQRSDSLQLIMMQSLQNRQLITGLYIITEVCAETLRDWLRIDHVPDPEEKQAIQISRGLIDGLCYVHQQGVIHRDLRPDNAFFAKEGFQLPIKLGDFGLSVHHAEVENYTITRTSPVGHHLYQAPEMKAIPKDNQTTSKYGKTVDLFSLGLTIAEIFSPEDNVEDKFNRIKYQFKTGQKIETNWPHVHSLILRLTTTDPASRGTLDDQKKADWWHHGPLMVNSIDTKLQQLFLSRTDIQVSGSLQRQPEAWWHHPPSPENMAETSRMGQNFQGPITAQIMSPEIPSPRQASVRAGSSPLMKLAESDIVPMRKFCLREKGFWTADNIRQFLDLVEPEMRHQVGITTLKKEFNSNMYRIIRSKSHLATKSNFTSAIRRLGYPNLIEKLDELSFIM